MTALVHVDDPECRWCAKTYHSEVTQPALFSHGGYGYGVRTRWSWCGCGSIRTGNATPVNPRSLR